MAAKRKPHICHLQISDTPTGTCIAHEDEFTYNVYQMNCVLH
jgi:hypothetical protein